MTTVDSVTAAVRAWLDTQFQLPEHPIVIVEGEYADGTHVAVGFSPDTFAAVEGAEPIAALIYRVQRDGRMSMTPATPEFVRDIGFGLIHERAMQSLSHR